MIGASWDLWEREVESAAIAEAVEAATAGRGGMFLVRGPAGIGKTRLLGEVQAHAVEVNAVRARARGLELEQGFAFGVVRQLFEPLLTAADAMTRERLWAGPAVQARGVFTAAGLGADVLVGDFAVLHGLYWLTMNACHERPLAVSVDDLQWCDVPSLRFLAYLLPRLEESTVLVTCAIRDGEPVADQQLFERFTADPGVRVVTPAPLSQDATGGLLRQALRDQVDPAFAAACHAASGGNPLLVCELARTLAAADIAPTAANADRVPGLGTRALTGLVQARLSRLPPAAAVLARAVAVLGDGVDWTTARNLAAAMAATDKAPCAGDSVDLLGECATLRRADILRFTKRVDAGLPPLVSFVHPLMRSAVYDTLDHAAQAIAHHHAATLLAATADADPERVAAHLLHTMPAGNHVTVELLQSAAHAATRRGAPGNAYVYLRRALAEPPEPAVHHQIRTSAGHTAMLVDLRAAAHHLQQAYDDTTDPTEATGLAVLLGNAYAYVLQPDRGLALWSQALARLPGHDQNRKRHLESILLSAATWPLPDHPEILARLDELRNLPADDSIGARMLDCAVASREMAICDASAIPRARRVMADPAFVRQAVTEPSGSGGFNTLIAADDRDVLDTSLQTALDFAHTCGSLFALMYARLFSATRWLFRGQLADAERDAVESARVGTLANTELTAFFSCAVLAEALTEQGRLGEAEQSLRAIGVHATDTPEGPAHMALSALAGLAIARGDHGAAVAAALRARDVSERFDLRNPAIVAWRGHAALALHAQHRTDEARAIADEDLELSRAWGAPRALGRALRIKGLITGGVAGLDLLRQAVEILAASPAELEYAKALADWGAALRRARHRSDARTPLRHALDIATRCGATPLIATARAELTAAGGRPRRAALTGPGSLSPSERRVADLAAQGATNRQIAQRLYVTSKTIEIHLSAVYRKLGITTRTQLPSALSARHLQATA